MRRSVASARYDKVGEAAHLLEQPERGAAHVVGRGVLEQRHGVEVAHRERRGRHAARNVGHVALVAEVVCGGSRGRHGVRTLPRVAAVVQNNGEPVVLNGLDNALHVHRGELHAVVVRQQSGCRLGHDNAVGASLLKREAVFQYEVGTLTEQLARGFGTLYDEHHYLRHVIKPASQREGVYAAREHGAVGYLACGQHAGLDVLRHAPRAQRRHLQLLNVGHAVEQVSAHGRHLVGLFHYVGAEGLCLYREVHYHRRRRRGVLGSQRLYGVGVHAAVAHGVDNAPSYQFDTRMRHYGHGGNAAAGYQRAHPFCHVDFHKQRVGRHAAPPPARPPRHVGRLIVYFLQI